jgi:hypothetical protein
MILLRYHEGAGQLAGRCLDTTHGGGGGRQPLGASEQLCLLTSCWPSLLATLSAVCLPGSLNLSPCKVLCDVGLLTLLNDHWAVIAYWLH